MATLFAWIAALSLAAADSPQSVVVGRNDAPATAAYDPFETSDAPFSAPAMPAAEQPGFDPFEEESSRQPQQSATQDYDPFDDDAPEAEQPTDDAGVVDEISEEPLTEESSASEEDEFSEAGPADSMEEELAPQDESEVVAEEAPAEDSADAASELVVQEADEETTDSREMNAELPGETMVDQPWNIISERRESDQDAEDARWKLQYGGEDDYQAPEPTAEQAQARRKQLEEERQEASENCEEIFDAVKARNIRTVDLDIRLKGNPGEDFPFDCRPEHDTFQGRHWPEITYRWKASGLCHKPLYFQEVQLERYGHTWGPILQPWVSGAHFFVTAPVLPYAMGIQTPNECVYTLGYYRPGSCAPRAIEAIPFTWRAAAFEAGAWTGIGLLFP